MWFAILAALALIVIYFISIYNVLIKGRIRIDEAWSDIDVQLKRRYDLIPNLISTVEGYAKHEKSLFTEVTKARTAAMQAHGAGDLAKSADAENMLSRALSGLMVQVENYPQLKANENFLDLQNELSDTENKIQASRRFYNSTVRDYNTKCKMFPSNIVADTFNFKTREFFDVTDVKERENVKVKF
ncbi:LemA family protein [Patescibacteria group bacterium]|nr:LemA family protein [Patescibacteria group bacterium]